MALLNIRFLVLAATLLSVILLLSHSMESISQAKQLPFTPGYEYRPPQPHEDPPNTKLAPILIFSPPKNETVKNMTFSNLPSEDDVTPIADEILEIYEMGRVQDKEAEEPSNGDDWFESYEQGVSAEMYKVLKPEENGDKIWTKHRGGLSGHGLGHDRWHEEVVIKENLREKST